MMKSSNMPRCAECGGELPPGLPPGLCPHCALRGALELSGDDTAPIAPVNGLSSDQIFERGWAQAVMERALNRLREEYAAADEAALFDELKGIQPGKHGESSYAEIGARLGLSEGTIASAVHRLRKRHREILREVIAETVARPGEINDEIRNLLAVLSR